MTSGDSEMTSQFGTWKRLPRKKQMQESCQRLRQLLKIVETAGSYGGLPARPAI